MSNAQWKDYWKTTVDLNLITSLAFDARGICEDFYLIWYQKKPEPNLEPVLKLIMVMLVGD